jgi:membrane-bound ClpP family serine protease
MNDRASRKVERQFLLGALVCAVLLIVGYLVLVDTVWGHQFDDDGLFARKLLNWRIITLDSDILDLVNKAALLTAGILLLVIATLRRCILVGVISVAGFACAVVGAEMLKHALHGERWTPGTSCSRAAFKKTHTRVGTRRLAPRLY